MLGGEEVIAALTLLQRRDAHVVGVAEEAVQDAGLVEAGNDEAADVGDQGDVGRWLGRAVVAVAAAAAVKIVGG